MTVAVLSGEGGGAGAGAASTRSALGAGAATVGWAPVLACSQASLSGFQVRADGFHVEVSGTQSSLSAGRIAVFSG